MYTHPARRLWATVETLHDVTYFAEGVRAAGIGLGLRGYWMTYFAFRAAPLGAVPAGPVVAAFAGFCPAMVAKALPDAWSRTTPQAYLDTRAEVSIAALRGAGADPAACEQAASLLGPVAAAADPTGRPLFAANAAVQPPDDPVGRLWQLTATLREHRGDGHIAAMVTEGITGLQAHLLQIADGRFPEELIRQARGWPDGTGLPRLRYCAAAACSPRTPAPRLPTPATRYSRRSRRTPTNVPGPAGWPRLGNKAPKRSSRCCGHR